MPAARAAASVAGQESLGGTQTVRTTRSQCPDPKSSSSAIRRCKRPSTMLEKSRSIGRPLASVHRIVSTSQWQHIPRNTGSVFASPHCARATAVAGSLDVCEFGLALHPPTPWQGGQPRAGARITWPMNLLDLLRRKARTKVTGRRRPANTNIKTGPAARALLNAHDESLSSVAHAWVRGLPVPVRPLELCNAYPRIANRIALCWDSPALVESVFNELLVDHRGQRKGFPRRVSTELLRLHAFQEARVEAAARSAQGKTG